MLKYATGLWAMAEPCLYFAYHQQFEIIESWLSYLAREGRGKDLETWGRISALATLTKQLDFSAFLKDLKELDTAEAWLGAVSVWTHPGNLQQHREKCLAGLAAGLSATNQHATAVAHKFGRLFKQITPLSSAPIELLGRYFALIETDTKSNRRDVYGCDAWLNATSNRDPMYTLEATEIYLAFVRRTKSHVYDHENNLTQLLTRLFGQAEELEESDGGAMLQRVVTLQDALLTLGVNGVNDWLKAVERP